MTTAQALASAGAMTKLAATPLPRATPARWMRLGWAGTSSAIRFPCNRWHRTRAPSGRCIGRRAQGYAIGPPSWGRDLAPPQNGLATQGGLTSAAGRMSSEASAQQTSALTQLGLGVGNLPGIRPVNGKATSSRSSKAMRASRPTPASPPTPRRLSPRWTPRRWMTAGATTSQGAPPGSGGVERTATGPRGAANHGRQGGAWR